MTTLSNYLNSIPTAEAVDHIEHVAKNHLGRSIAGKNRAGIIASRSAQNRVAYLRQEAERLEPFWLTNELNAAAADLESAIAAVGSAK